MFHNISMPVDNPFHVAKILAEIWQGQIHPLVDCPDSYVVLANDEYGTAIELVPSGTEMRPGQERFQYQQNDDIASQFSAVHIAISVPTKQHEIEQIATREGWHCSLGNRGQFKLIEFWVENKFLLEFMPSPTVPQYVKSMTPLAFRMLVLIMPVVRACTALSSRLQKRFKEN